MLTLPRINDIRIFPVVKFPKACFFLLFTLVAVTSIMAQTIKVVAGGGAVLAANAGTIVATTANLAPSGIAVDSAGNIYFGDNSHVVNGKTLIDRVNPSGQLEGVVGNFPGTRAQPTSTTPAPANSVDLGYISYLAVGNTGNIYYADLGERDINEVVSSTGDVSLIIGNGGGNGCTYSWASVAPESSGLPYPTTCIFQAMSGIALDSSGDVYSADSFYNNPFEYFPSNRNVYYMAGGCSGARGIPGYAPVSSCTVNLGTAIGAAYYSGSLFVLDSYYGRIYKVSPATAQTPNNTTIVTVAGGGTTFPSATPIPATTARFNNPVAIASDSAGNMLVLDQFYNYSTNTYSTVLDKVNSSTGTVAIVAGGGTVTPTTTPIQASQAKLNQANGVAVDSSGNIYISDGGYSLQSGGTGFIEEVSY